MVGDWLLEEDSLSDLKSLSSIIKQQDETPVTGWTYRRHHDNMTKKIQLKDWEGMKAEVPDLNSKGLSIRLTVTIVDVGTMGMYINLALYGLNNLK